MAITDSQANSAMISARTLLSINQPFFGCLALHLNLVEVTDRSHVSTMAVDGRNLYYHPPFVHKMTTKQIRGVVAHEVMHCAFKHFIRRGHRDHQLYNIAGDFVINADLLNSGFELPGKAIGLAQLLKKPKKGEQPETGHLFDPQFAGMGTEEVYEKLLQHIKVIKVVIEDMGNDPGGCGSALDGKNTKGENLNEAERTELDAEWDSSIRQAVSQAKARNAGKVPGHLARLIAEMNKPKVNWRAELRDFVQNSMSKDYSWLRPNRRSVGCGVILPGFISDAMQHLVVVMDCSGSVDLETMKQYGGEAGFCLDDGVCDKMTVIYTDTKVQKVEEYLRGDPIKIEAPDGGGTDFKAVMDWIPDNCQDAAAIVFLTDMMTNSFGQDPDIPVLWGATVPASVLAGIKVPFGRVVEVNTKEWGQ